MCDVFLYANPTLAPLFPFPLPLFPSLNCLGGWVKTTTNKPRGLVVDVVVVIVVIVVGMRCLHASSTAQHSTVDDASRLVHCPRRLLCFVNRLIL